MTSPTVSSVLEEPALADGMVVIKGEQSPETAPRWPLATRIAFRFVFVYFVLLAFPYEAPVEHIVLWVGNHILHLASPISTVFNGSGDTTYAYVEVLCFLVIAGGATALWSLLDRKRTEYRYLHQWLRLGARIILAGRGSSS